MIQALCKSKLCPTVTMPKGSLAKKQAHLPRDTRHYSSNKRGEKKRKKKYQREGGVALFIWWLNITCRHVQTFQVARVEHRTGAQQRHSAVKRKKNVIKRMMFKKGWRLLIMGWRDATGGDKALDWVVGTQHIAGGSKRSLHCTVNMWWWGNTGKNINMSIYIRSNTRLV